MVSTVQLGWINPYQREGVMHLLSTFFRIIAQIIAQLVIAVLVPGGLIAVICYQIHRFKKRRAAKKASIPPSAASTNQQPLPQSRP